MTQITPQPGIMDIALYQGGAAHVAGVSNTVKLSSNENPLGASPTAVEAMAQAAAKMHRYPSSDHIALRTAIAETHGLDADRIICGKASGGVGQVSHLLGVNIIGQHRRLRVADIHPAHSHGDDLCARSFNRCGVLFEILILASPNDQARLECAARNRPCIVRCLRAATHEVDDLQHISIIQRRLLQS